MASIVKRDEISGQSAVVSGQRLKLETPAAEAAGYYYKADLRRLELSLKKHFQHMQTSQPAKAGLVIVACRFNAWCEMIFGGALAPAKRRGTPRVACPL